MAKKTIVNSVSLFLLWLSVNLAGTFIGLLAGMAVCIPSWEVVAVTTGILQALFIGRTHPRVTIPWILVTAVGVIFAAAGLITTGASPPTGSDAFNALFATIQAGQAGLLLISYACLGSMVGTVIGTGQAFVLRAIIAEANLWVWIIASSLGLGLGAAMYACDMLRRAVFYLEGGGQYSLMEGGDIVLLGDHASAMLFWFTPAAATVTGIALVWLQGHTKTNGVSESPNGTVRRSLALTVRLAMTLFIVALLGYLGVRPD